MLGGVFLDPATGLSSLFSKFLQSELRGRGEHYTSIFAFGLLYSGEKYDSMATSFRCWLPMSPNLYPN
jgi:hypothetical protein